jgi:PAS domain S-box-containing protein
MAADQELESTPITPIPVGRLFRLLRALLRTLLICALAILPAAVWQQDQLTIILATLDAGFFGLLLWRLQPTSQGNIATLAALGLLATADYAMIRGSGLHDVAAILLPAVLLIGALAMDRRRFALVGFAVLLSVVALGALQIQGIAGIKPVDLDARLDKVTLPVVLAGTAALAFFIIDSLARSLATAEASEQNYREVFNATSETIAILDSQEGRLLDVNDRVLNLTGYDRREALQLDLQRFAVGPAAREDAVARFRRAAEGEPQVFETLAKRRDEREVWVEVAMHRTRIRGEQRVLAVIRDISERKLIEDRLRQSEKLQAVGLLAGGVAHDFNNQLAGISGYAELMRNHTQKPETVRKFADGILSCTGHAAELTSKLLAFARKSPKRSVPLDLHELIGEVAGLLKRSIDRQIDLKLELGAKNYVVLGDLSLLQNALLNLGLNARDAMPHGGQLVFRTAQDVVDDHSAWGAVPTALHALAAGTYLRIEVADEGVGMDESTARRVFEPFFTTKEQGNGMGLAAVYGTVQDHGGAIEIVSRPGKGTTCRIWLPTHEEAARPSQLPPPSEASELGLRVLLVEDESELARATGAMLKHFGCLVNHCSDGQAALEAFARQPDSVDLVMMDLIMPRMNGVETL